MKLDVCLRASRKHASELLTVAAVHRANALGGGKPQQGKCPWWGRPQQGFPEEQMDVKSSVMTDMTNVVMTPMSNDDNTTNVVWLRRLLMCMPLGSCYGRCAQGRSHG